MINVKLCMIVPSSRDSLGRSRAEVDVLIEPPTAIVIGPIALALTLSFIIDFFQDNVEVKSFKFCIIITFHEVHRFIPCFGDLDFVSVSQVCQNINCTCDIFQFLFDVV